MTYAMKKSLYLFIILCSIDTYGQHASVDSLWKRKLYRIFLSTQELGNDSCYYSSCLLKIDLDKNSKIISRQFSDNVDTLIKNAFTRIFKKEEKLNSLLEKEARKLQVRNVSLILPITIISWGSCMNELRQTLGNKNLYTFNKKYLTAHCFFLEPFTLITNVSPGKVPLTQPAKAEMEQQ